MQAAKAKTQKNKKATVEDSTPTVNAMELIINTENFQSYTQEIQNELTNRDYSTNQKNLVSAAQKASFIADFLNSQKNGFGPSPNK